MNVLKNIAIALSIFTAFASVVHAQDMGQVWMDNAAASQNAYMTSHINNLVLKNMTGKNAGKVTDSRLTYNPSIKIRDRVIDNMAARMKLNSSQLAALKQMDLNKIFANITAPYRSRYDDAADIVTAYQVLNWMIANKAPDPKPVAVTAVRNAVIPVLQQNREIAHEAGNRAMMSEEMKLLFVMQHAGWQEARKTGKLQSYSDAIARQYQQLYHQDLRSLKLDAKGLHP
jgi:hypothetical protein